MSKVRAGGCVMSWPSGSDAFDDGGDAHAGTDAQGGQRGGLAGALQLVQGRAQDDGARGTQRVAQRDRAAVDVDAIALRSEEHTSELQSRQYLVCRLLLEKKKKT